MTHHKRKAKLQDEPVPKYTWSLPILFRALMYASSELNELVMFITTVLTAVMSGVVAPRLTILLFVAPLWDNAEFIELSVTVIGHALFHYAKHRPLAYKLEDTHKTLTLS